MATTVRVEIELDLDTGAYALKVNNVSNPGQRIDSGKLEHGLRRVIEDIARRHASAEPPAQ